jgi:SOS response regulatory protein OraA/RecX
VKSSRQPLSLKARALAFLSAREHSRSELRTKLLRPIPARPQSSKSSLGGKKPRLEGEVSIQFVAACGGTGEWQGHDEVSEHEEPASSRSSSGMLERSAQVDAVLDQLEALKYLSDERFVESLAHRRASRYGVLKLKHELKSHKIAEPLVKEALEQARSSELERANEVWSRKFLALPESPEDRMKQQRFLVNRGFTPSVIYKVLKGRVAEEG